MHEFGTFTFGRYLRSSANVVVAAICLLTAGRANAQHLWWDTKGLKEATCLYGEITVLATHEAIYYCGANWHPGEPAGGYCGIQHNGPKERRTIFSIWDTSPELRPKVTEADPKTVFNHFGGEGEGSHTHMVWNWQIGETFRFFVEKRPGVAQGTTDARYYAYDPGLKKWRHVATISSPHEVGRDGGSVATIGGGGLGSFLENFSGMDRDAPKLALYRLWLGTDVQGLKCLTRARGDGIWGQQHDCYFLAEGKNLDDVFSKLKPKYGGPLYGEEGGTLAPISNVALPKDVIKQLKSLPRANRLEEQRS